MPPETPSALVTVRLKLRRVGDGNYEVIFEPGEQGDKEMIIKIAEDELKHPT